MTRFSRAIPVFGFVVLLAACGNPNFRVAVNAARDAEQRGDVATAADQWTLACRIDPTDEEACARAKGTSTTLRQNSVATAKPQCESAASYEACLNTLAQSRGLFPDDPDMNAIADTGAALYVQSCQALEDTSSLTGITGVIACLEKVKVKVGRPAYSALVDQQRKRGAVLCARNFDAPSLAAGHGFRVAARCLDASAEPQSDVDAAAQRWMAKRRVTLRTSLSGGGLNDGTSLCNNVAKALGPFASCSALGGALSVSLTATTRLDESRHTVREELKDATFVSGYTQQANPDYLNAQNRVSSARASLQDAERQLDRCARAGNSCSNRSSLDYQAQSRRSEVNDAQNNLGRTPVTVTVPVHETINYTTKYHNWATPWTYQLTLVGSTDSSQNSGEAVYDDTESPAIPKANVRAEVLENPTRATFEKQLFDVTTRAAATLVREHVLQKTACASGDGECLVTRIVYTSGHLPSARDYMGGVPCDGER